MITDNTKCKICGSDGELTFHHFIPVSLHRNKKFKKLYNKEYLSTSGIYICGLCHSTIHKMFSEKELGNTYNTYQKLLSYEKFKHYVHWIKRRKNEK